MAKFEIQKMYDEPHERLVWLFLFSVISGVTVSFISNRIEEYRRKKRLSA